MTNNEHSKQTEEEALDWLDYFLIGLILGTLLVASVLGHAAVSVRVMP